MSQLEQADKYRIINRFIFGVVIWMVILVIITFVQNDYSRGVFFLSAMGISLVYFAISCFLRPKRSDIGSVGVKVNPVLEKDVRESRNQFTLVEIFLLPGYILGSWIFGVFSLRK